MDMAMLHAWHRALIVLLNVKGVEYLLVGGYAVRFYGGKRETKDLDLWVPPGEPGNAARIGTALEELWGEIPGEVVEALAQPDRIVRVGLPGVRLEVLEPVIEARPVKLGSYKGKKSWQIEFLTIQSGVEFREAYAARQVGTVEGVEVSIVSLEHLKVIKASGGRQKDLVDLGDL